jgi:hypothetical protein
MIKLAENAGRREHHRALNEHRRAATVFQFEIRRATMPIPTPITNPVTAQIIASLGLN